MATKWNQVQQGNAWVTDGAEGFWAEFPRRDEREGCPRRLHVDGGLQWRDRRVHGARGDR